MNSAGEQCLLTLPLQNVMHRDLEFRVLKFALFRATKGNREIRVIVRA